VLENGKYPKPKHTKFSEFTVKTLAFSCADVIIFGVYASNPSKSFCKIKQFIKMQNNKATSKKDKTLYRQNVF